MKNVMKMCVPVERMEGVEWLMKRVDVLRVEGRRRRGRPIREDCVKRDLGGVKGEWRMRARDGGGDGWWRWQWDGISDRRRRKTNMMTGINASLILLLGFRDKEESNNKKQSSHFSQFSEAESGL